MPIAASVLVRREASVEDQASQPVQIHDRGAALGVDHDVGVLDRERAFSSDPIFQRCGAQSPSKKAIEMKVFPSTSSIS